MSDRFTTELTIEELVQYIRKTPKQFAAELPDKLEKYIQSKIIPVASLERRVYTEEEIEVALLKMKTSPLIPLHTQSPEEDATMIADIAGKIVVMHAPNAVSSPESLADYAVECAQELVKRLKQ